MVSKRLSFVLEQQKLLSKFQCGFRKHHSPIDHLIRLESDVRKGYKMKQHTTAIFLDIKNAFDMVYKPALIYKIHKMGIRGHMAHYLCNFLSGHRRFRVKHRSIFSDTYETENGLPQGSCLSPVLFNIMIDDLFHDIPSEVSFSLFADDSAIWCTTPDYDIGIQRLQSALHKIEIWSTKNGLEFSAEKSAFMIFSRNRRIAPSILPKLNNSIIPLVPHFKFLGVVLDSQLSMNHHVKHIQTKCKRRLNLFRCITGTPAGADRSTLLRLYKAIVLPIIEYGSIVYAGGKQSSLVKLEAVQNNFIRLSLGVMKTSPIPSLQVEANIPPLLIRQIDLTMRYYTKIKQLPDHAASSAIKVLPRLHFNYLGRCEKRTGLTIASRIKKFQTDINYTLPNISPLTPAQLVPWLVHPLAVSFLFEAHKNTLSPDEIQQTFFNYQADHPQFRFVFTDGSKINDTTGIGIFSPGLAPTQMRLRNTTSIYYAELYAIFLALKLVQQNQLRHACICSDSKSAIQSLKRLDISQHTQSNILKLHQELFEGGIVIQFLWIPGHSNITGNERADCYAKEALNLPDISETPLDHGSIKSSIKFHCLRLWQNTWNDIGMNTQLYQIKPQIKSWHSSNRNSRRDEKILARLRIGHTYLTHSFIFAHEQRPTCSRCRTVLNVEHILINCTKYNEKRKTLQHYCRIHNLPLTLPVLLGDDDSALLKLLFKFLSEIDLIQSM